MAGSNPVAVILTLHILPVSSKDFPEIQAIIDCRFTLKCVRGMIITYSQIYRINKYLQHSSIIWSAELNGCVFVYKVSGCWFESRCCHVAVTCPVKNETCIWNWIPHLHYSSNLPRILKTGRIPILSELLSMTTLATVLIKLTKNIIRR